MPHPHLWSGGSVLDVSQTVGKLSLLGRSQFNNDTMGIRSTWLGRLSGSVNSCQLHILVPSDMMEVRRKSRKYIVRSQMTFQTCKLLWDLHAPSTPYINCYVVKTCSASTTRSLDLLVRLGARPVEPAQVGIGAVRRKATSNV